MTALPAVTLTGARVTLAPLTQDHAADLTVAARRLGPLWYTSVPSDVPAEIDRRTALPDMTPFALLTPSGQAVGMTTYMNCDLPNRRVEIGSTWMAPETQRTGMNTEAKRLLLANAFEAQDCIAVEFRTHRLNTQSRRAIERLGAQFDGILRAHMIMENGTIRDTAVYSITAPEWPTIRAHLDHLLDQ